VVSYGVITVSKDSSGSKDFIREVTKKYKPKAIIKPKGQPKKDEKENKWTVLFIRDGLLTVCRG